MISDFKFSESAFLAKSDVLTLVEFFKSDFVAWLEKFNLIGTFAPKDFGFGKSSLIYTLSFLSIQL